jgi:hypothetical protein
MIGLSQEKYVVCGENTDTKISFLIFLFNFPIYS